MAPKLAEVKELNFTTRELAAAEFEAVGLPANNAGPHDATEKMPTLVSGVSESGPADRPKRFINVSAE